MKYNNGTTSRVKKVDVIVPPINEMARPWKIGSERMITAPNATAPAVSSIGVVLTAPASMIACLSGIPSLIRMLIKSINNIEENDVRN